MSRILGYVVIEWNQAGGPAALPQFADIHPSKEDAEEDKQRLEGLTAMTDRRERYEVAMIELPEDDDDE